jgi:hypothetical protein
MMLSFTSRRPRYHAFFILLFLIQSSSAWTTTKTTNHLTFFRRQSSSLLLALPEGYQEFGEQVIRRAGASVGVQRDEDLTIDWKEGRIIVSLKGSVFVSTPDEEDCEEEDEEEPTTTTAAATDPPPAPTTTATGVDVTRLAKAINVALDDDGVGFAIAEVHEIEVTTPGASEELSGIMFESYKGFDVICRQEDSKTKKVKTVEGKLVERNDEFTVINIKGRIQKLKNDTVLSVKLPKAKKEKGVK